MAYRFKCHHPEKGKEGYMKLRIEDRIDGPGEILVIESDRGAQTRLDAYRKHFGPLGWDIELEAVE